MEIMKTVLDLARLEIGTKEVPGRGNNPKILAYGRVAGIPDYSADSIPWCAVFVGAMLAKAGLKNSGSALARSYMNWGRPVSDPYPGCIAVFPRGNSTWQGHVGIVEKVLNRSSIKLLGGNQSDAVNIKTVSTRNVLGFREADIKDVAGPDPTQPTPQPRRGSAKDFVKAFQKHHGLVVDGIPGPITFGKLFE